MHPMVENAQRAIEEPEVQEMLRRLAPYGLGVFMPHLHPDEGGFAPLPEDLVQLEGDLQVSFVRRNDPRLKEAVPVGWVWDGSEARATVSCFCGGKSHGPEWEWHKKKGKES